MKATIEERKVSKALGIRETNIEKIERLINGFNIYVKNRQKVSSKIGDKNYIFAHHSQIARYRNKTLSEIKLGEEE